RAISVSKARPPSSTGRPSARSSRRWRTTLNRPNSMITGSSGGSPTVSDCSAKLQNFSERIRLGQRLVRHCLVRWSHDRSPPLNGAVTFMSLPAVRAGVQRKIQVFLQALAAGGGKPIEQMSPREAREALEGLQSSVKVDLPRATLT